MRKHRALLTLRFINFLKNRSIPPFFAFVRPIHRWTSPARHARIMTQNRIKSETRQAPDREGRI